METTIQVDRNHLPLLDNVLTVLQGHMEELLVRLSKFLEIKKHLPAAPAGRHQNIDLLAKQCSFELTWAIQTYSMYKGFRELVEPLPVHSDSLELPGSLGLD
ncbi:hypothetical protein F66182_4264 [Fusarium sp. NRRL 66182]|nr:hypothetical protein F66182_4264 [Fusarium sp. NRRL 66182]